MRLGTIAFLIGILAFHTWIEELPERWWGLGLAGAVLLIGYVPWLRLPAWGLAGFLWALIGVAPSPSQLPAELESVDLWAEGWVASIPETFYRSTRFQLAVGELRHGNTRLPLTGRLRLSWYNTPPPLQVGDKWGLTVRLKRPRGLANPGSFDYERWLFVNGIAAQGYVRDYPEPRLLEPAARYPVDRFRQGLAERFGQLLPDSPYVGILTALAVGERQGIAQGQWEVFTRTGTGHLMAISGLHIGLIAGWVFILTRYGWAWFPTLTQRYPAPQVAALAALFAAASYALLAGLSLPTQRAFIMITVAMLALLMQRPVVPSRILALALLLVLIIDPTAPLAGGFWLSFGAVAAILYTLTGRGAQGRLLREWLGLQLVIALALLPATLILFQSIPLLSPLANLIAIPWAGATVVPLTLLAVVTGFFSDTLAAQLLGLAALAMDGLWRFLAWLGSSSWALIFYPAPPVWTLMFALPGILWLLAPRGLPGRWLGGVLCLPLLFPPVAAPAPGEVWFTLLDVGQGLAAVVRTANHVLVYDTGPRLGTNLDAGRAVLVPFLRQQGVKRVDTLIISHADSQHTGGARSLLEGIQTQRVMTSSLRQVPIEGATPCRAGQTWSWDEVQFHLLYPPEGGFTADNASCVLLVTGKGGRILLPGDIEASAEATLLKTFGDSLAAEILVAPHHGNRNLSLPAFISAVQPHYVLFSTAYQNRYGFPKPETVERYRSTGAIVLNTADQGAITFRLEGGGVALTPESYRYQVRRYWHSP